MKLYKICNSIVEICLLLIIGLVPLYFHCWTYRCWEINTFFLLQVLIQILVLFWLIKQLIISDQPDNRVFSKKILKNKLILSTFFFFSTLLLATIFSDSFQFSFLGAYVRKMGFITWFYLFLFFLVLISQIKTRQQIQRILITILITSSIVSIYGVLQRLGIDFIEWAEQPLLTGRIISTFGQPNFLGSWLLLVIPIVVYCLYYFKNFYSRFFIALLTFFLLLNLVFTLSRGAWLGLIGGFIFFISLLLWLKQKKRILLFFGLCLLVISIAYIGLNIPEPPSRQFDSSILNRLESLIYLRKSVTGYTRLIIWQTVVDLIKQRPILGYGPERLAFYSIRYYQPRDAIYMMINSYPDRAHNDILDMLFTTGILGLLTYLFLLGNTFFQGLQTIRQSISKGFRIYGLPLTLLVGLFGYLVSLQFSFHVPQTLVYFWLYIGLIIVLSKILLMKEPEIKNPSRVVVRSKIVVLILLCLVSGFLIWQISFRMILADFYFHKISLAIKHGYTEQVMDYYAKVFKLQPDEPFYRGAFAADLLDLKSRALTQNPEQEKKILDIVVAAINDIPIEQRYIESYLYQAMAYSKKANLTREETDFQIAETAFQKTAAISPQMAKIYNTWCQLKIYEKKWDEAKIKCQKALSLYPDLKHPHLNQAHRQQIIAEMIQVYEKLGQIYLAEKKYEQARTIYWSILRLNPFQFVFYKDIADTYYLEGDLDTAIQYNLRGMTMNPVDSVWPFSIALLYKEKGDLNQARQYGQKALELAPENESVKNFLDKLK